METAIQTLRSGTGDIVAMSAFDWIKHDVEGLAIAGLLPRKEPTWVLVAMTSRSTWSNVRVMCEHELLRRQMRRMRPDLILETIEEVVSRLDAKARWTTLTKRTFGRGWKSNGSKAISTASSSRGPSTPVSE